MPAAHTCPSPPPARPPASPARTHGGQPGCGRGPGCTDMDRRVVRVHESEVPEPVEAKPLEHVHVDEPALLAEPAGQLAHDDAPVDALYVLTGHAGTRASRPRWGRLARASAGRRPACRGGGRDAPVHVLPPVAALPMAHAADSTGRKTKAPARECGEDPRRPASPRGRALVHPDAPVRPAVS